MKIIISEQQLNKLFSNFDIQSKLRSKYPDLTIDIYQNDKNKIITLSRVIVPKELRQQGIGTKFMNDLISMADELNYKITLTPDDTFGGTKSRLRNFYKQFGFIPNKGRNRDFSHKEDMYKNSSLNEHTYKVYHGTNEKFKNFNFKNSIQGIVWFTDSPDSIKNQEHGGQGNKFIMTRYITLNKPAGWDEYEKYGLQQLEEMGYDGVILPQDNKTDYFVFSNKNISAKQPLNEDDYRGNHTAPNPDSDDSPMYNASDKFGEDIYGPKAVRMFGGYGYYDEYSVALINQARNKPNYNVKIYRAVPKVITNQEKIQDYQKRMKYIMKTGKLPRDVDNWQNSSEYYDWLSEEIERLNTIPSEDRTKINIGDWVTISFQYAKEHGQSNLGNKFRILSKTVTAKNLFTDGNSIHEWGYYSPL